MKPIGIQRIERRLDKFNGLIDMADWSTRPRDQQRSAFLSRSLAAYCVKIIADIDDASAAASITDSFHDRGLDAIYFDAKLSRLLVVQSKWTDCIAWREAGEFVDGVRRLIAPDWKSFANNPRILKRQSELDLALLSSETRIVLITVHKGSAAGDDQSLRRIDELAQAIDGGSGLAESIHWHQKHLLEGMQSETSPQKINADLYLANWGEIKNPYHAVYGRIQAPAVVQLWENHPHLAHMNIREYSMQWTGVNSAIADTVLHEPEHFWYFNNGLTLICDSIKPGVVGRLNSEIGLFHLEGIRLVNGAQTTGIVSGNLKTLPEKERDKLWIQVRAIAVGKCPDGFATQITKFTNLQNAVTPQDLVALDHVQSRLAIDFALEKRKYAFKWGTDPDPNGENGCSLKEATIALACAHEDSAYTVQAKREIGVFWLTDSDRYKLLFHKDLTAQRVWNAVKIMRAVDMTTASLGTDPRKEMICVHLKRVILHLVFRSAELREWEISKDPDALAVTAAGLCANLVDKTSRYISANHSGDYLASLSKNFEKCQPMIAQILIAANGSSAPTAKQGELFN
jgi:hypothetical protein